MNSVRKTFIGIIFILFAVSIWGQTSQVGKRFIEMQQYNRAKKVFLNLLKTDTLNGELFYYLGKSYFEASQIDSAKYFFEKGIAKAPKSPYNYIGMAAIALDKNKKAEASAYFEKAKSYASRKDEIPNVLMAEAYLNQGSSDTSNITEAFDLLFKAKKINSNNSDLYVLLGDAYSLKRDNGKAMSSYETSTDINKKYPLGYLKVGELYLKARLAPQALEAFNNVISIDSTYAPVYRDLGEMYYLAKQYDKAISNYKIYLNLAENNINAKIRYAQFLFLSGKHDDAVQEINTILTQDTTNVIIYRLLAYSACETNKMDEGLNAIEKFFSRVNPNKIIPSDYIYFGKLLVKGGKDTTLAIHKLEQALNMDSTILDADIMLVDLFSARQQFDSAAFYYLKKMYGSEKKMSTDYYKLGLLYYQAKKFVIADSAFSVYTKYSPNQPLGYLYRARCNTQLDTGYLDNKETAKGLANPYYELFLQKATDQVKYKGQITEAYRSLSLYYFLKKDKANLKIYVDKLLAVDPTDDTGVQLKKWVAKVK